MIAPNTNTKLGKQFAVERDRDFLKDREAGLGDISMTTTGKEVAAVTEDIVLAGAERFGKWAADGQVNASDLTVEVNRLAPIEGLTIANGGRVGSVDNDDQVLKIAERQAKEELAGKPPPPGVNLN